MRVCIFNVVLQEMEVIRREENEEVSLNICLCVYVHVYIFACVCVHLFLYICASVLVYVCVCVYICVKCIQNLTAHKLRLFLCYQSCLVESPVFALTGYPRPSGRHYVCMFKCVLSLPCNDMTGL